MKDEFEFYSPLCSNHNMHYNCYLMRNFVYFVDDLSSHPFPLLKGWFTFQSARCVYKKQSMHIHGQILEPR